MIGSRIRIKTSKFNGSWKVTDTQEFMHNDENPLWTRCILKPVNSKNKFEELFIDLFYNNQFVHIYKFQNKKMYQSTNLLDAILYERNKERQNIKYITKENSHSKIIQIILINNQTKVFEGIKLHHNFLSVTI